MNGILQANLDALGRGHEKLVADLEASAPATEISFQQARSGAPLPVVRRPGRSFPLHSTVDPVREGARLHERSARAGFLVFLGLGGAYHISPFLEDPDTARALIIEKDFGVARAILENIDLRKVLGDQRTRLVVDPKAGDVERAVLSSYLPALMGNLRTVPLAARCGLEKAFFEAVGAEVAAAAEKSAADYAAQARFGRRWFMNTLLNLPSARLARLALPRPLTMIVAGAGPSLEPQMPLLRMRREKAFLTATDTSLPVLLDHGIEPDLVISMDCQQYGYLHLLAGRRQKNGRGAIPFLLDLASPPVLARETDRRGFYASGHPLSQFIRRHWLRLPSLDTTGGNVTSTAISLAQALGAREVLLFGVDYSYPLGKPYVRGTYISHFFASRSGRLNTEEGGTFAMMFRGEDVERERIPRGWRYTTPLLLTYKRGLEELIGRGTVPVTQVEGSGLKLTGNFIQSRGTAGHSAACPWEYPSIPEKSLRDFLDIYAADAAALPLPGSGLGSWLDGLAHQEREVLATLLPLVPSFEKESSGAVDRPFLLAKAVHWAVFRVRRVLSRGWADDA